MTAKYFISSPNFQWAKHVSFIIRGAGLWDFTLRPVEMLKKLEKNGLFRLTGTFSIGGVPIHVEVLTGRRFGRLQFAVGFSFDKESFGKLSEKLSGIGIDFLDVIGLDLEVMVAKRSEHLWSSHYKLSAPWFLTLWWMVLLSHSDRWHITWPPEYYLHPSPNCRENAI